MCLCTSLGQLTGSAFCTVDVTSVFLFQTLRDNFDSANVAENIDDSENLANIIRKAHSVRTSLFTDIIKYYDLLESREFNT